MTDQNKISAITDALIKGKPAGSVYFLGIGGIGMSALARYFKSRGFKVSGYDKTETVLTRQLLSEGIEVHFDDDVNKSDRNALIVVYTPAIPSDHSELNFYKQNDYTLLKRSDVLGIITKSSFNICVAGTHGKTTTSAMIAFMLRHSGYGCNAFLGGIAANYGTNFWSSERNVSVAEADEYDRSFLKLDPDIAVITSMDPDHLDIYGTEENMQDAFIAFTGRIKKGGLLVCKQGLKRSGDMHGDIKISYSLSDPSAKAKAENITVTNGSYVFDIVIGDERVSGLQLNMGGRHNIENAVACIVIAKHLGIGEDAIRSAISSFAGVKRRFEYVLKSSDHIVIDDYAHHPEELRALINGTKELYPGRKCKVVFQPHLFSRTRDLAKGFAEVLSLADEVILLPIYPAREEPIEGVTSEMILKQMRVMNKKIMTKDELLTDVKNTSPELLVLAGAGDIDTIAEPVKDILNN